jgi:hypothetical protein
MVKEVRRLNGNYGVNEDGDIDNNNNYYHNVGEDNGSNGERSNNLKNEKNSDTPFDSSPLTFLHHIFTAVSSPSSFSSSPNNNNFSLPSILLVDNIEEYCPSFFFFFFFNFFFLSLRIVGYSARDLRHLCDEVVSCCVHRLFQERKKKEKEKEREKKEDGNVDKINHINEKKSII